MESSIGELVLSGVKLMFIGMGIVYLFLALLVWVISTTSKLIHRYAPEHPRIPSVIPPAHEREAESEDTELVAAITAAIHQYQNK